MACREPHVDCRCDTCGGAVEHRWSDAGGRRTLAAATCPNHHRGDALTLPRPTGT